MGVRVRRLLPIGWFRRSVSSSFAPGVEDGGHGRDDTTSRPRVIARPRGHSARRFRPVQTPSACWWQRQASGLAGEARERDAGRDSDSCQFGGTGQRGRCVVAVM